MQQPSGKFVVSANFEIQMDPASLGSHVVSNVQSTEKAAATSIVQLAADLEPASGLPIKIYEVSTIQGRHKTWWKQMVLGNTVGVIGVLAALYFWADFRSYQKNR